MAVPRSKLFLAGNDLRSLSAAIGVQPDAIAFDLEDAIAEQDKASARCAVTALLRTTRLPCKAWVRVNGAATAHFIADVLALEGAQIDAVNLPKVEDISEVIQLDQLLRHLEAASARSLPIGIVPTIETPRGMRQAAAIAAASPRVLALQLGAGDLMRRTGITAEGTGSDVLRVLLSLAAAEAGIAVLDSTPHGMDDLTAFEADAHRARSFGFAGKSCMLGHQVAVANSVFGTAG